jgi:hypothetical protein
MSTATTTVVAMPFEQRVPQLVHRNRHILGPPAVGVLALGAASAAHVTAFWPWADVRWLGVLAAVVYLGCGLDAATSLPSRTERLIAIPGWFVGAAWLGVGSWLGPWSAPMLSTLAAGVVVFGVPWAWHRRVRRGVEVDRLIPAWKEGHSVGLPGTTARGVKAGVDWLTFRVRPNEPGRYTLASYRQSRARIAALFGVRTEAVSITETDSEGEVDVTIRQGKRPTVTYEPDAQDAISIVGEHRVGTRDDGGPLTIAFYLAGGDGGRAGAQHGAGSGATGSGKSSLVNRGNELVVRATDAVLWLGDLSLGAQELRAWAPACDWFATTPDEIERMIEAATAIAEGRGNRASSRLFVPSAQTPLIVMMFDEAASIFAPQLLEASAETGDRIAAQRRASVRAKKHEAGIRNYRKHGIAEWAFTQYGDAEAFGGATARDQLISGHAAVFYAPKDLTGHLVIPASHGVSCSQLPPNKPGTLAIRSATMDGTVTGRIEYMDDEAVAAAVARWKDHQSKLEDAAVRDGGEAYRRRQRAAPGSHGQTHTAPRPAGNGEAPRRAASAEESREIVFSTLARLGSGQVHEVAEACDKSTPLVRTRLSELVSEGRVTRQGAGRWTRYHIVETR